MSEKERRKLRLIIWISSFVILIICVIILGLIIYLTINPSQLSKDIEELISNSEDRECSTDEDCNIELNNMTIPGICLFGGCYCASLCEQDESECCGEHGEMWGGICWCSDGWYGKFCQFNNCPNITNSNCTNTEDCNGFTCYYGVCICKEDPNYTGDNCELERRDLSFCNSDEECIGGKCIPNTSGNGECYCPLGTISPNCEF